MRNSIGLPDGGEVELELDGAGLRIDPVRQLGLGEEDELLVIPKTGKPITGRMVRDLIDYDRDRR